MSGTQVLPFALKVAVTGFLYRVLGLPATDLCGNIRPAELINKAERHDDPDPDVRKNSDELVQALPSVLQVPQVHFDLPCFVYDFRDDFTDLVFCS